MPADDFGVSQSEIWDLRSEMLCVSVVFMALTSPQGHGDTEGHRELAFGQLHVRFQITA
jgi:hypothetical protein